MTDEPTTEPDPALLGIGLTANIVQETGQGHGGLEIRRGTKHFSPGTKVWVVPPTGTAGVTDCMWWGVTEGGSTGTSGL